MRPSRTFFLGDFLPFSNHNKPLNITLQCLVLGIPSETPRSLRQNRVVAQNTFDQSNDHGGGDVELVGVSRLPGAEDQLIVHFTQPECRLAEPDLNGRRLRDS